MTTVLELEACSQSKILVFLRSLPAVLFYRSCNAAEHAVQLHQFNFKNHYSSLILSKFKMFDMLCHGDFYHALRSASSPGQCLSWPDDETLWPLWPLWPLRLPLVLPLHVPWLWRLVP